MNLPKKGCLKYVSVGRLSHSPQSVSPFSVGLQCRHDESMESHAEVSACKLRENDAKICRRFDLIIKLVFYALRKTISLIHIRRRPTLWWKEITTTIHRFLPGRFAFECWRNASIILVCRHCKHMQTSVSPLSIRLDNRRLTALEIRNSGLCYSLFLTWCHQGEAMLCLLQRMF